MKGFINVIKPAGISSAKVVTAVKRKFHLPCGHMGTLDPMASGILPVGIDKTSRLFPYLLGKSKVYTATFLFGVETDTLDVTGNVTEECEHIPTEEEIKNNLKLFVGEIEQLPPKYSAKCIGGKRGYQLARSGVEFTLEKSKVNVISFELLKQVGEREFVFHIECKGGTYIRSLARDLGYACNSLATMKTLSRDACGIFDYSNGVTLEEFENSTDAEKYLIAPDLAVDFPPLVLTDSEATRILNGLFDDKGYKDGVYRVYNEKDFWGIGIAEKGVLRIKSYVR